VISKQKLAIIAKGLALRMKWFSREYFRRISNDVRCVVAGNQVRLTTRSNSYPVTQKPFAMARMSTASPVNTCWSLSRRTKRVKASPCRSFVKCFTLLSQVRSVSRMWRNPLHCSTTHERKTSRNPRDHDGRCDRRKSYDCQYDQDLGMTAMASGPAELL